MISLCIDLKSFYASVECVERGLDPMITNLVVADPERGDKTICLAITPAMKKLGIKNRCRVFEIPKNVQYIMAEPRMKLYIDYATAIYSIYLNYISKDDIHVYSIDEAFLDVTSYLKLYHMTARELAKNITQDILRQTGIQSTCGIGTNLYLAKIALDILAKHADDYIGYLDENLYREKLWQHKPLTDFWRIGPGIARKLANYGINTMEGIATSNEDFLYRLFGIDAELLIDHAWGREPTTIADIKAYTPKTNCITSGQVLMRDYDFAEGLLIIKEMADLLCLDLAAKEMVTKSITLQVGYANHLKLEPSHGTAALSTETNLDHIIRPAVEALYKRIVNPQYQIRRVNMSCNNVRPEKYRQITLFDDTAQLEKSHKVQSTVLDIKQKYGKNAILKAMNLEQAATTRERNRQIGGHKSGD